jgi:hypothetical protein
MKSCNDSVLDVMEAVKKPSAFVADSASKVTVFFLLFGMFNDFLIE